MQVGIDVECMHASFGGCGFFGFGDMATFQKRPNPFWGMDYSPWSSKNLINQNRLKKIMQVGTEVMCMHASFGGCDFFGFGDIATFQKQQISLLGHTIIVHHHRKI